MVKLQYLVFVPVFHCYTTLHEVLRRQACLRPRALPAFASLSMAGSECGPQLLGSKISAFPVQITFLAVAS